MKRQYTYSLRQLRDSSGIVHVVEEEDAFTLCGVGARGSTMIKIKGVPVCEACHHKLTKRHQRIAAPYSWVVK